MRFKKGIKVEVLSKGELSLGAWRPAEIILGNGHYYSVRYYGQFSDRNGAMIERVPRKAIRPCPPVRGAGIWIAGDIVEVCDNNLWKISKVLRPLGRDYFFVRLFGSSLEIKVCKSDIRARLSWQDDHWIVIGQNSRSHENREPCEVQTQKYLLETNCELRQQDVIENLYAGNDHFIMENTISLQGSQSTSSRSKRRLEVCSSHVETYMESGWKKRRIEKEDRHQQLVSQHPSQLQEKVDAASERILSPMRLEPNDAESSASCSVASCGSSNSSPYMFPHHSITGPILDDDDAESSSGREYGRRCSFLLEEDCAAKIHRSELQTYRSTMEALYASGPLSWEQEAMMTNLRLSLHISIDEHLSEIRHLVSA